MYEVTPGTGYSNHVSRCVFANAFWKPVKPFLEEKKMNYPVVIGDGALIKRYGVESMPTTLLIDRDSRIAATHLGLVNKDVFESEIRTLLQGNKSK